MPKLGHAVLQQSPFFSSLFPDYSCPCFHCGHLLTSRYIAGYIQEGVLKSGLIAKTGDSQEWKRMERLLQFEQLLFQISATYINLPSDEIEKVIRRDLERLGRFLGVDRCNLYLVDETEKRVKFDVAFAWWTEEDDTVISGLIDWMRSDPTFFDNFRYYFDRWSKGEVVKFAYLNELPEEAEKLKETYLKFGTKSALTVPISVSGAVVGALMVATVHSNRSWPEELVPRLRLVGEVFVNSVMRKRWEDSLKDALAEIKQLKAEIEADYLYLKEEIDLGHDFREIVGKSEVLKKILVKVKQVAPTNATVLILGETGTGKGLIARALHNSSMRKDRPLMQVNCAALTPNLIESELFGHEKGAFTGANIRRLGRFELARGTTLFLDEIGDLPLELQPKLLRVLQEGEFERVGGSTTIKTDVRIVAATNRDLAKEVEAGRFRRDLWYRLSTFPIFVPPLRQRLEDIPLFVSYFAKKYGPWMGKKFEVISQKAIRTLQGYSWPGNIRELENVVEQAVITSPSGSLRFELPECRDEISSDSHTMYEFERTFIVQALEDTHWKIEGTHGAAARLGLKPSTLRSRMKKHGITRISEYHPRHP
jgi:formate hydrogenlyase transcriptional activator